MPSHRRTSLGLSGNRGQPPVNLLTLPDAGVSYAVGVAGRATSSGGGIIMRNRTVRVYCAGPLFNPKEREEMSEIAQALEEAGFDTFLPQRDGLELTVCVEALARKGIDRHIAARMISRAIFALDVYQVLEACDAIVVNLNGRVPDEGAVSEAALAWCEGKAVVGYKADGHAAFHAGDNPLVAGLFDFNLCGSVGEVVPAINHSLTAHKTQQQRKSDRRQQIASCLTLGEQIWRALQRPDRVDSVARVLAEAPCPA